MAHIDNPDSQLTAVKWRFPSVHPEGRKYVVIAGGITLLTYLAVSHFLGWLLVGVTIWVAAFFRDPVRTTPTDPNLVVSPADGLVTMIARVPAPPQLRAELGEGEFTRVSIFMSVFDVHINRTPITGTIRRIAYIPGKFLNADLDKASEDNERQHFLVEGDNGVRIAFTQIAGLVARRILSFVREGQRVTAGERIGLIRFGSRVDVFLPAGTGSRLLLGQRAIAGETIIAELGTDPMMTGTSQ
ncbi:phosphatidylserine decarboxylase [Sphingomonas astaxanthinifaciens]|uniref:Phosphatidylserine decarboxylase proenzyme n=1 Tax=Sphingomonas astaxanthinifaciens DSM 22298 TaxID=1123267 RepID=A0ABQ5Z5B4_9SPHN|nr:phosphatidylserine decarboxylase [Sphingomonas astaxanthinifaciens]GLR47983.1 phosphatidylserine decarboxylase proenzyme [Sphingomonas astaxanthinifaciens DSM 22298]